MENKKTYFIIAGVLLIAGIVAYDVYGSRTANNNDVDTRLQQLEKRLSDTETEQRKTTAALESAQRAANASSETAESIKSGLVDAQTTVDRGREESNAAGESISDAAATVDACQAVLDDSGARLTECESIFERVEQSNKAGTK